MGCRLALALLFSFAAGCGDDDVTIDGGSHDGGLPDGGSHDSGVDAATDASTGGIEDASAGIDGFIHDAEPRDGGSLVDAEEPDAAMTGPDTCADALPIALDGSGAGQAVGRFDRVGPDYATHPSCGVSTGGASDAVYAVDVPEGLWDLTIDTIGSAADTVLALAIPCEAGTIASPACSDDISATDNASRLWVHRVQVGSGSSVRLFVVVFGASPSEVGD